MKLLSTDYSFAEKESNYRIEADRRLRTEEYFGKVRLEDLRAMTSAMASDPCWSPNHHALVDFTQADLELSSNDVLRMALIMRQERNRSNGWLVFAVSTPVAYGIVRMLGYWSRNTERIRIFQSRKEAETWLARHRTETPPGLHHANAPRNGTELRNAV